MTDQETRKITLTNRAPVMIVEADWPTVAEANDRPGSFINGTPRPNYECDHLVLKVRQHADGRALVYGVIDAADGWTQTEDWRGGEVLPAGSDLAAAIRRVGEHFPAYMVRSCIADLPAEAI